MRKILMILALMAVAAVTLKAQTGAWTGKLKVSGVELALIFNIGEESATLDVPDQGAKDIPVEVSRDAVGGITLNVPAINASFKGLWAGKVIAGTFTQHGMSFPMTLPTKTLPKRTTRKLHLWGHSLMLPRKCRSRTGTLC